MLKCSLTKMDMGKGVIINIKYICMLLTLVPGKLRRKQSNPWPFIMANLFMAY